MGSAEGEEVASYRKRHKEMLQQSVVCHTYSSYTPVVLLLLVLLVPEDEGPAEWMMA